MKSIRNSYSDLGVEKFYEDYGDEYTNPHFPQVRALLLNNHEKFDCTNVLDFCCGGGEVSLVLQELKYSNFEGSDPFTQNIYKKKINKKCLSYSFEDVIRGKVKGKYSAIICSFAMHLCPENQLYPLCQNLFQLAPTIIIITPHKRPILEKLDQVHLDFEDFVLTPRGKKVRLKMYSKSS